MDKGELIFILLIALIIMAAVILTGGVTPQYPYSPILHDTGNSAADSVSNSFPTSTPTLVATPTP